MWENSSPQQIVEPKKQEIPKQSNHIVGTQFLLCLVFFTVFAAGEWLNLPYEGQLRKEYLRVINQTDFDWLKHSDFCRFAEQTAQTMLQTAETETRRNARNSPPPPSSLYSEKNYIPSFSLIFPLKNTNVTKTSAYGWRVDPMGGKDDNFHTGIDLALDEGEAVLAASSGVVRYAGNHSSYGNYVRILHGNGDETLYAHMQYLFVHTGETVTQGEQIGTVGETGNATGPHLHFEILHQGVRYDPTEALQKIL